jgi:hypothetical protein
MNRRHAFLTLTLCCLVSSNALAIAQIPEEIQFEGRSEMLFSEPLNYYLVQNNNLAKLEPYLGKDRCSGSWRGYRGTWEIRDSRLHLLRLETSPCSERPTQVPLSAIFFDAAPVLAKWYTGTLVVPTGRRIEYVHLGYESRYEWYIVFTVVEGRVVDRRESSAQPK